MPVPEWPCFGHPTAGSRTAGAEAVSPRVEAPFTTPRDWMNTLRANAAIRVAAVEPGVDRVRVGGFVDQFDPAELVLPVAQTAIGRSAGRQTQTVGRLIGHAQALHPGRQGEARMCKHPKTPGEPRVQPSQATRLPSD